MENEILTTNSIPTSNTVSVSTSAPTPIPAPVLTPVAAPSQPQPMQPIAVVPARPRVKSQFS